MRKIHRYKKKYLREGRSFTKSRRKGWIDWEVRDNEGDHCCSGCFPTIWNKYSSRIKYKLKKDHDRCCRCYWCLKEHFRTHTKCPQCKKRELKSAGYHRNNFSQPHESGTIIYCKCGYKKDLNEESNKILREINKRLFK